MKIQQTLEIDVPNPPNFVRVVGKTEGGEPARTIPVGELTDDELKLMFQIWTAQLYQKAKTQRDAAKGK